MDGCNSHENNIAILVLEFAKGTLLLLRNLAEAVVNEMIACATELPQYTSEQHSE